MLLHSVRQYLASHHMHVDDEWLSGCVEYLTEDSSNNYNENDIKNLAKEQWLLNDLKDICPGSLPANLKNLAKTVLNGRFVLQINAAVDIGTPAYQQYLKLQKINMENVEATTKFEDKISSHRMIKLHLTDGVQEITAIEYRPMRNISCDITPGCKVLIKGPIECRRGMLLLTEAAVELLGGEVQEIAVSNSLAGLLSTKLGVPITQEPDPNTTLSHPRNANIPTPHTQMPSSIPQTFEPTLDHRPVARVTSLQLSTFNDDVIDDDIDIDQLAAIEAQIVDNPVKRSCESSSSNPEKKLKIEEKIDLTTSPNKAQNVVAGTNRAENYPDDDDLFFNEDEEYLRELEDKIDLVDNQPYFSTNKDTFSTKNQGLTDPKTSKENQLYTTKNIVPIRVPAEPFVYIKQITDMKDSDKAGRVFRVKAQILKVLSKLSLGKDGWSLKCTLVDGTGSIDVDFTSEVLSELVGITPQEMNQLKKQMATKPESKEKAVSALQKAKDTLQVLYCIIELTMLDTPKITCLTPFEAKHVDLLSKRMESVA